MILVLLRHGRTQANEAHLYCGSTDLSLSENGRAELEERKRKVRYPSMEGLRICTSGMQRTNETLKILYGVEPEDILPQLAEMDFGSFEMHSYNELKEDPEYLKWILDETGTIPAKTGESRRQFHDRVCTCIDSLDRDSLIVTHGGVITAIMTYLFPEEHKGFYDWQPDCGCGYLIDTRLHTYTKIGEEENET